MRKYTKILAIGLVTASLMLSGCGTEVYELTADEEALIVKAAAYYVAKHNVYQKDGVSNVYIEESETEEANDSTTQKPDDTTPSGGNNTENNGKPTDSNVTTLASAAGMDSGLKVTYVGSSVADHVEEGISYSVDAGAGFTFYVMTFKIENTTTQAITVDNAASLPVFKLTSGTISTKSSVSFLSTDFSTYQGTIDVGQSVETVLLFKINATDADKVSNPTLQITIDGVTKTVEL